MESFLDIARRILHPCDERTLLLVAARLAPICLLVPALGGSRLPMRVRTGILVALTAALAPAAARHGLADIHDSLALQILREVALGLAVGFVIMLTFELPALAGGIIDYARGHQMASQINPASGSRELVSGQLLTQSFIALFFATGADVTLIRSLAFMFQHTPPGRLFSPSESALHTEWGIGGLDAHMAVGVQIAGPVLAIATIAEVALAFSARLDGTFNAMFIGIAARGAIGVAVLLLCIAPVLDALLGTHLAWIRIWM